jgi:hypothetical protein
MSANADIMTETLGWAATTVIVGSYFCGRADTLRRVQMAGALMWLLYGLLIEAYPVVVAKRARHCGGGVDHDSFAR